jgi:multicomponent Na+:H+ antiporter subunit D
VLPRLMVGSTLALVVLGTGLTVVSGPLFDDTTRAAAELLNREPYVRAVFAAESP